MRTWRGPVRLALWLGLAAALAPLALPPTARAARLVDVRAAHHARGPRGPYTRVVFQLDRKVGYRIEELEAAEPPELRLTLDAEAAARRIAVRSPLVKAVEIEPSGRGRLTARLLLATRDVRFEVHSLTQPDRVYLDIRPSGHAGAEAAAAKPTAAQPAPAPRAEPSVTPPVPPPLPGPARAETPAAGGAAGRAPAGGETPAAAAPPAARQELGAGRRAGTTEAPELEAAARAAAGESLGAGAEAGVGGEVAPPPAGGGPRARQESRPPRAAEVAPRPGGESPRLRSGERPRAARARARRTPPRHGGAGALLRRPEGLVALLVILLGVLFLAYRLRRSRAGQETAGEIEFGPEVVGPPEGEAASAEGERPPAPGAAWAAGEGEPEAADSSPAPAREQGEGEPKVRTETEAISEPRGEALQAAGGPELRALVEELAGRVGRLEARLEGLAEARERFERQLAAQTEELRVQRAAIARTQRVVRSLARGDDAPTEPAPRPPSGESGR